LGYTLQRPTEDRFLITFPQLKERMVVLMAGRAAEQIVFDEVSTGASDDLAKVTDIARECVTRYGMSDTVGNVVLEERTTRFLDDRTGFHQKDYSEETGREIDLAVRALVAEAFETAKSLLQERRSTLDEGARLLLERESLTPGDFAPLKRDILSAGTKSPDA
jgi:cell division protease FtsH